MARVIARTIGAWAAASVLAACALHTGGLRDAPAGSDGGAPASRVDAAAGADTGGVVTLPPPVGEDAAPGVDSSVPGQIAVTVVSVTGSFNLTALGTNDWVHWGRDDARTVNRKADGSGAISGFASIGTSTVTQYTDNAASFAWSNGAPTASESGTTTGVYVEDVNHGFSLDVAAALTPRTLYLFVGGYKGAGQLDVRLTDGSASEVVDKSKSYAAGNFDAEYTIVFNASTPGARLVMSWTLWRDDTTLLGDTANVTLQAAALE